MAKPVTPWQGRFWAKVDKTDGCWLWTGALNVGGYGAFFDPALEGSSAHRHSYRELVGLIPDGLDLDHLCRVRSCVRPDHLEPVTRRENLLRGATIAARNAAKTHCIHGHEFTPENTITRSRGRECRTCKQAINNASYARRKASV